MSEPSKIPQAWAGDGDYNTIPSLDPGNGLASWELGFPVETQTPLAAGGTPPRRQDVNGALYWLSLYSLWTQQGGLWQYDATENYERGNVILQNNALYIAVAANGPNSTVKSPSADTAGTYWKKLVNADGTLNVPTVGNATTTARGIVELATSAETKALTDTQRAVTPSSLNGLLSLSPSALMVPKADSNGKLTGWLNALKDNDGRVNISIKGTAPTLQTARTVRVALGSTSAASFDGSTNITPGVSGVLNVANGGTGQNNLDLVTVGKSKALNTARSIRINLGSTSAVNFDGTANITPGVTGTLAVTNGGTGQTDLDAVTVGKAKALNTARNINGTAFNGTANITTAQWGTARNATIKDASQAHTGAAVSVNGAANFALLLPSTITAALIGNVTGNVSGNAGTATKLQTARTINGTSFNGTADIIAPESSARSFGNSGYIKFQSGLIIQWGRSNFSGAKYKDVSLPVTFPNALFAAYASDSINAAVTSTSQAFSIAWSIGASDLSKVRFVSNRDDTELFVWLAIGN